MEFSWQGLSVLGRARDCVAPSVQTTLCGVETEGQTPSGVFFKKNSFKFFPSLGGVWGNIFVFCIGFFDIF
jgi:hypothetical protein